MFARLPDVAERLANEIDRPLCEPSRYAMMALGAPRRYETIVHWPTTVSRLMKEIEHVVVPREAVPPVPVPVAK